MNHFVTYIYIYSIKHIYYTKYQCLYSHKILFHLPFKLTCETFGFIYHNITFTSFLWPLQILKDLQELANFKVQLEKSMIGNPQRHSSASTGVTSDKWIHTGVQNDEVNKGTDLNEPVAGKIPQGKSSRTCLIL